MKKKHRRLLSTEAARAMLRHATTVLVASGVQKELLLRWFWDLQGRQFSHLRLKGAGLCLADFTGSRFTYTSMRQARIIATSFRQIWAPSPLFFEDAYLRNVSFWGADATGLVVREASMKKVDMRWSDLSWMQAQGLEMTNSLLDHAILRGAVFNKAQLSNVSMRCCDLSEASFDESHLAHLSFSCPEKWGQKLPRPAPTENRIVRAQFVRPSLRGASFRGAVLERPDFRGADLTDTDFRGAKFLMPRFEGARFQRTDFSGATVEGVTNVTPKQQDGAIGYPGRGELSRRLIQTRPSMRIPRPGV